MDDGFPQYSIRYEGNDAERHVIDMMALGVSLQGFSRIYSAAAHLAITHSYAKQMQTLSVRAYASEPRAKCFDMPMVLQWVGQAGIFSGVAAAIIGPIVTFILVRAANDRAEMKAIKDILQEQLRTQAQMNAEQSDRMLSLIERLADSLKPSAKQAVSPVGDTCERIDIVDQSGKAQFSIDRAMKDSILANNDEDELTAASRFQVIVTMIDRDRSAAKVRLIDEDLSFESDGSEDSEARFNAVISDPALNAGQGPYYRSLSDGAPIVVTAKALLRDGSIRTLYISDAKMPE